MWVEINCSSSTSIKESSSSSWGCELKYRGFYRLIRSVNVILFVRMWVEIVTGSGVIGFSMSSSSWGCELKYTSSPCKYASSVVILFVRMWVEIIARPSGVSEYMVILFVRMWVEITIYFCTSLQAACHPLREDVSWNAKNWFKYEPIERSSSSWGCELKYYRNEDIKKAAFVTLFVRMWVEMSLWSGLLPCLHCHPLREDVSWNKFYIHRI